MLAESLRKIVSGCRLRRAVAHEATRITANSSTRTRDRALSGDPQLASEIVALIPDNNHG
jgi:hypothetical protein